MRKISWYYEDFLMKWWEISWFCYVFMAPSSVFLTFSWEISHNIIILRFCNIVEGQANYMFFTFFLLLQNHRPKLFLFINRKQWLIPLECYPVILQLLVPPILPYWSYGTKMVEVIQFTGKKFITHTSKCTNFFLKIQN